MSEKDVYRKLQEYLDTLPVGYPATESGVEIRILKRFFTPEEAEIALKLSFIPDTFSNIYQKIEELGISRDDAENMLNNLTTKGAITGVTNKKTGEKFYSIALLAVGIFEYQVGKLTKEFVEDFEQYLEEAFKHEFTGGQIPQLRTIPIEQSIKVENFVSSYDDVRNLIETRSPISVANCVCRESKEILGKACSHIREACFQFGGSAYLYIEQGLGREISKEEAHKIINKAQGDGLVLQPGNSQKPFAICCCCGCCCEVLNTSKRFDKPAEFFASNHFSEVDADTCTGCEACIEVCPMDAMEMKDDVSVVNLDRCIGCGVCVPSCSFDAIELKKKDQEKVPPMTMAETYMKMLQGKNERRKSKELIS